MHMSDDEDAERSEADEAIEREIRNSRKFTLEEAIARMAGPGAMKGASPIARKRQAELEIEACIRSRLADNDGGLKVVLARGVKESEILLMNYEQPLAALATYCQQVLSSEYSLKELVRAADTEWGRVLMERPYFEKEGSSPHPDDPYTVESVRSALSGLIEQLAVGEE
jgi:hypothetical protein